ncbi:GAF and ANTAR domain-containing protein [Kocuria himachalensis]
MNVVASDSSVGELAGAFARLQGLLLDADTAAGAVTELAEVARDLIPLAVGAGVTLIDKDGEPTSLAATDPGVEAVDRMQYEAGEGPCLTAWDTVSFQRVEDTYTETRWPDWAAAAAATGVRSVLSTPLIYQGQEIGAVKVYAAEPEAFTEHEEHLLGLLAGAAATLSGAIQDSRTAHQLSGQLHDAVTGQLDDAVAGRPEIQQAVGLLMERHDLEADTAHARLLAAARQQQLPVLDLAVRLLHHAEDPRL